MLSTAYRKRLEFICTRIAQGFEVQLEDMIWAEKLAKANTTARDWLRKARQLAKKSNQEEESLDGFLADMGLGDPDPTNHRSRFDGANDLLEWFREDKPDDWRQRD